MIKIQPIVRGAENLEKNLKAEGRRQKKALNTAIKVEGHRQHKILKQEMREGEPGNKPLEPLSAIAKRTKTGRKRKNTEPLSKVAGLVRYRAEYRNNDIQLSFGFIGSRNRPLSTTWKKLLTKHQEGKDVLYSGSRRALGRKMARIGARLKKKGDPDAQYFFLRKSTGRRLDLPARPVISSFWRAHDTEAKRNITRNYQKKLRGEYI